MSPVHLSGPIQLPVLPSLALRGCGRPKKFWSECVKADVEVCNIEGIDPQNIEACRSGVRRTSQLQLTPGTGKLSEV